MPVGNVVLVRPGTLRRTTSGKTQRTLMRRLFLEDRLSPLFEVLDPQVENLVRPRPADEDALSAVAGGPRDLSW